MRSECDTAALLSHTEPHCRRSVGAPRTRTADGCRSGVWGPPCFSPLPLPPPCPSCRVSGRQPLCMLSFRELSRAAVLCTAALPAFTTLFNPQSSSSSPVECVPSLRSFSSDRARAKAASPPLAWTGRGGGSCLAAAVAVAGWGCAAAECARPHAPRARSPHSRLHGSPRLLVTHSEACCGASNARARAVTVGGTLHRGWLGLSGFKVVLLTPAARRLGALVAG
jgi:hypothetical protein